LLRFDMPFFSVAWKNGKRDLKEILRQWETIQQTGEYPPEYLGYLQRRAAAEKKTPTYGDVLKKIGEDLVMRLRDLHV